MRSVFQQTFLGMDYVKVETFVPIRLELKPGLGIFLILTIFFLLITLGFWAYSEWKHRRKSQFLYRQSLRCWP